MNTCKERIGNKLKRRIADIKKLWQLYQKDPELSEDIGTLDEYGISFEYTTEKGKLEKGKPAFFKWLLSTGGPGDEFRFFVNPDLSLYKVEYWFFDWFDSAKITLKGNNFKLLNEIWDCFLRDFAEAARKEVTNGNSRC